MPSHREIMRLIGLKSKAAIFRLIEKLVASGIVAKDASGRLIPKNIGPAIRVVGYVEAGWPSPAEEETIDTIPTLDEYLINNKEATFIARVKGDSMTGIGIMLGDEVLVQRGLEPKNGNIVIATLDNQTTIKRYNKVGSRVFLMPENKKYEPIEPKEGQELILNGVVISLIRKF